MTSAEKARLLAEFEGAYDPIRARVAALSQDELDFTPPEPADAWPVRDHLVHLLEADMILWFRARVSVAEPGASIPVWDQEAWRSRLRYGALEPMAALNLAGEVRRFLAAGFRSLLDADWDTFWVVHPERGRMSLAQVLALYRDHPGAHIQYIERNLAAYRAR